jgi:triosephosphate isomerase
MSRRIHIVGNWKMNQSLEEIKNFFIDFTKTKQELNCESWIAPQAIHLSIVKELAFTTGQIQVGAQNCSFQNSGAFTGESSPQSLADMGALFTLVGHSERRAIFNEDNQTLNSKMQKALSNNLKVIFCVGETLEEREDNQTFEVLKDQLTEGLKNIPENKLSEIIIAYEPVWAIGTGKTASPDQAQEVHSFIRKHSSENIGLPGNELIILYGGSVKPNNIDHLLACPDIDGALVGGASLKGQDFRNLCNSGSR